MEPEIERCLWKERTKWLDDIQEAMGDWGGPERELFNSAMSKIFSQVEKRLGSDWKEKLLDE